MYQAIVKPLLFLFEPEKAHSVAMNLLKVARYVPGVPALFRFFNKNLDTEKVYVAGLAFPNAVGLAAGFDKNGKYLHELAMLGFGFVEVGTVTPLPQAGNDLPRLFRLPQDNALINRMGFNNEGVDALVERLKHRPNHLIVGGNIGKNKITPNENAVKDYAICFEKLFNYVDYFVVNVSSPNTPGLRELQEKEPLQQLLAHLQHLNTAKKNPKPIFLKIAPDLTDSQLDDIVDIVTALKLTGVVATNTTIDRSNLQTSEHQLQTIGVGGLSGSPLKQRATQVITYLHQKSEGKWAIIGVGGVFTAQDAIEKKNAGAVLIQIYTGFIYEGMSLITKIRKQLAQT